MTATTIATGLAGTRARMVAAAIGKVAEWIALAAMLVVIPRVLGPADYGVFGIALALASVGSAAFALGGPTLMARFVAAAPPDERAQLARALALRGAAWRAGGMALLAVVVIALVLLQPDRFPPRQTLLILAAVAFDAGATLCFQVALGLDRAMVWSFRYPIQNLFLVVAVPLLYVTAGVTGALAALVLSSALAMAAGLWIIRGHLGGPRAPIPSDVSRFALLQGFVGVTVQVMHRGGVVAVALLAASRAEAGYTALAMGMSVAAIYGVWQLFVVTLPSFAQVAATDEQAAGAMLARLTKRVTLAAVPFSVVGAILAAPVLTLLAGGRFAPAERALAIALASVPLAPVTGALGAAAAIRLRPGTRLVATGAGTLLFIALAWLLVPGSGAAGASVAFLAGNALTAGLGAALFPGLVDRKLLIATLVASGVVVAAGAIA